MVVVVVVVVVVGRQDARMQEGNNCSMYGVLPLVLPRVGMVWQALPAIPVGRCMQDKMRSTRAAAAVGASWAPHSVHPLQSAVASWTFDSSQRFPWLSTLSVTNPPSPTSTSS